MIRLSFGPRGEFFIESDSALSGEQVEVAESLYKKIMQARVECDVLHAAMSEEEND